MQKALRTKSPGPPARKPFRKDDLSHLADAVLSSAGVGIYIVQQGKFVYISPLYKKLTGYSDKELIGTKSLNYIYPGDRESIRQEAIKCLKAKRSEPYEYRFINKQNEIMYVLEMITPTVHRGERATLGSFMDITLRKRMEEALKSSEENYRLLFESAGQGILIAKDQTIQFANVALADILGYSKEVIAGRPFTSFIHPEDRSIVLHRHLMRMKGETPENDYSFRIITSEGTVKWLQVNSRIISWNGGPASLSFITDITERKRAEDALRRSEEKYRTIIEEMVDGYFEVDLAGNYTFVNEAESKSIGYSRDELIGMNNRRYQDEKNAKKSYEAFRRIYKTGEPVKSLEVEIIRKDGTIGLNEISVSLKKDHEGKPIGFQGFTRDITDRKNSMDQLRKALGGTVLAIASVVETKDPYTAGHQRRVADLARTIAREMGLSQDQIEGVRMAGIIHDIGKVSVPAEILSTPRRLTAIEFSLIQTHAQSGHDILKEIEFPWPIARMVLEHHERMNGSGYPKGLRGDDILPESRILAVADVVEAMATHRPYRAALGLNSALEEIAQNKGVLYDPEAVDACLSLFRKKDYEIKM